MSDVDNEPPKISDVKISNLTSSGFTVTCTVTDNVGIDRVQFPTWTIYKDQDDLDSGWWSVGKSTGTSSGSVYTYVIKTADHNNESGKYAVDIYAFDTSGNKTMVSAPSTIVPDENSSNPTTSTKEDQSIIANSVIKTIGNKSFSLGASAPGKLTYKSNNKKVATINSSGKVKIKGAGIATITINASATANYNAASKQVTVTVRPKKVALKSLANSKKGKLKVKWKKGSEISGYKIQIARNADFTNAQTVTVKKASATSMTVKVKKGKTYWVRIQTYKGVVDSAWSKSKKIKIRK